MNHLFMMVIIKRYQELLLLDLTNLLSFWEMLLVLWHSTGISFVTATTRTPVATITSFATCSLAFSSHSNLEQKKSIHCL